MGGGTNRMLWIAAAVLAVVGLVGLVVLFGRGDDGGGGGGSSSSSTPATSAIEESGGYNATIERNFMDSCTANDEPGQAVCQCAYDKIEATVPFDRFVEIDDELNDNPEARPQELIDILTECTSQ
jgi:hypothetical protein